jgi:DNA polymerase I-like protein with 3'-5' exonuclease and polymerase domains
VVIADKVYDDPKLHAALLAGKKIHNLMGVALFPELTEDEVNRTKSSTGDVTGKLSNLITPTWDIYTMSKSAVFALIYGGNYITLMRNLGLTEERARAGEMNWLTTYTGIMKSRERVIEEYSSLKQPGGIGSRVIWNESREYVESLLGHRRYFTLENKVCKALFDLANNPLPRWKKIEGKVVRRDRAQTIGGAVMSALFACAFNIQSSKIRAAGNHEIQSTGAQITKDVQLRIWNMQPVGVGAWIVQPSNCHDEINCVAHPDYADQVIDVVNQAIEEHKQTIPLLKMDFKHMNNWGEK